MLENKKLKITEEGILLDNFYPLYSQYKKGYYSKDSIHILKQNSIYANKNKEKILIRLRKYRKDLKFKILSHYGGNPPKCSCCNESIYEFLCIDHINGKGSEHRKILGGGTNIYLYLVRNNYPEGFQILCHNCNMSKGFYGYCPHEKRDSLNA